MAMSSHTTTTVVTMMPPAVFKNPFKRVHMTLSANRAVGSWYVGKSMTSASSGTARHRVLRSAKPTSTSSAIEMTYIINTTLPAWSGKNVAESITNTTKRAEHDVNGMSSAVMMRWRGLPSTRVAEIAGTLQPKPTTMGINALPGRPMARIRRSVTTAARAM